MSIDEPHTVDPNRLAGARRRNSMLAALEIFREIDPGLTLNNIVVFLYVAENEGLNISELAAVAGLSTPTASRSARSLAPEGDRLALPPYLGLIRWCGDGPARSIRTLRLSPEGEDLRDQLERRIADAVPIRRASADALSVTEGRAGPPAAPAQASL